MFSKSLLFTLAVCNKAYATPGRVKDRDLHSEMKDVDPKTWHAHPRVRASICSTNVDRLKKGPVNIPDIIKQG